MISDHKNLKRPSRGQPQFSLGDVFVSFDALENVPDEMLQDCLACHAACEAPMSETADKAYCSVHYLCGQTLWIVTKHDLSQTEVFLTVQGRPTSLSPEVNRNSAKRETLSPQI